MRLSGLFALVCPVALLLAADDHKGRDRWIVVLSEPPAAAQVQTREEMWARGRAGTDRVAQQQRNLRAQLARRPEVMIRAASDTLLNALYISAPEEAIEAIRRMPGVEWVAPQRKYRVADVKAAALVNAAGAWAAVGGDQNAGAGVKIGIIDTGIDKNHPAFQDPSLRMPPGFPKCLPEYCDAYTSNKIIAARAFVEPAALAGFPNESRPDDLSPRDRVGHGTAVASVAAGVRVRGPAAEVQGVAPKAYLGSYKVFGSPGVNDFAFDESVLRALEAAFNDGMDIVNVSLGAPAEWYLNDRFDDGSPRDPQLIAVERAVSRGMVVVVDAGNSGDSGTVAPGLGTINTPGTAPSAITVGGSTNSHYFFSTVFTRGENVPENLREIDAQLSNGLKPARPITARLVDVSTLNDNGRACQPLGNDTLKGAIALIQRGDCEFVTKLQNAQRSGAIAAIIFQRDGSNFLFPISNIREAGIPAVMIGNTAGVNLKRHLAANPATQVTIDPALVELDGDRDKDQVAYFSSYGPAISDLGLKPDLVAVATDMYMATQTYDPNGSMYDATGYFATQGTSFSTPQVSGAAAILRQRNPRWTPAQIKSALVNTANREVTDFDSNGRPFRARVTGVGGGKLDAGAALRTNVTVEPASLSFGIPVRSVFQGQNLRITNTGSSSVSLRFNVQQRDADSIARVTLSASTATLGAGQSTTLRVTIQGPAPRAGSYEGVIEVTGGATPLRVPYLYLSGDNQIYNIIPLRGQDFTRETNRRVTMLYLVVDRNGVPAVGRQVSGSPACARSGNQPVPGPTACFFFDTGTTDDYGIAEFRGFTGRDLGYQEFVTRIGRANEADRTDYVFSGRVRQTPALRSGGIVNAASQQPGAAPGSLIAFQGVALSEGRQTYSTPYLPLALSNVSVSFDDPVRRVGYPGRILRVSETEVVAQIPWELEGMDSIVTKVSIGDLSQTDPVELPLSRYAPGVFEYLDSSGRQVAYATDENNNLVGAENGVAAGAVLNLLVNGLGPVDGRPVSGEAPAGRDLPARLTPVVRIGGERAEVRYAGLAPELPGFYLVSVVTPSGIGSGRQTVELEIDGNAAKTVNTVVR